MMDVTQLFCSFRPCNFASSITHVQNALEHNSSWTTATNSPKTDLPHWTKTAICENLLHLKRLTAVLAIFVLF